MSQTISRETLWPWRPLYWEPVSDSGERLMVGVVHGYDHKYRAVRTIRDDVLDCMYKASARGIKNLIDHSLSSYQLAAESGIPIEGLDAAITGLHPGPARRTAAKSENELLQVACLLFSSLGNLDASLDENLDLPLRQDQMSSRFSTDVKNEVVSLRPDLATYFGNSGKLVDGGKNCRFGFFSAKAILHFTVLNPDRQSAGVKDSRSRIFELLRARDISGITTTALIASVPDENCSELTSKQRDKLLSNKIEIEMEADSVDMRWFPVTNAKSGAQKVIELAG